MFNKYDFLFICLVLTHCKTLNNLNILLSLDLLFQPIIVILRLQVCDLKFVQTFVYVEALCTSQQVLVMWKQFPWLHYY